MEAIMKAFERMEKAQQRRQESIAKTTHRKDPRDDKDEPGDEVDSPPPSHGSGNTGVIEKRVMVVQEARNKTFRRGLVFFYFLNLFFILFFLSRGINVFNHCLQALQEARWSHAEIQ